MNKSSAAPSPDEGVRCTLIVFNRRSRMHTPSCHSFRVQIELERHWYHIAYPTHCSECDGAGGWCYSDDPSDSGVSLSPGSMTYFEPCDDCFLKNRCPRCGESLEYIEPDRFGPDLPSDFVLCRSCGWDEFNSESKGMMQHHECYCWEIGLLGL